MSDFNPINHMRDRCNEMCNSLWKHMDKLNEHIEKMPEGQSKEYIKQYHQTLGYIAELYAFQAFTFSNLEGKDSVIQALFKEVFKDKTIQLPYSPEETLSDIVKRLKEKEPTINWVDKELKDKAKDVEKS